MRHTLAAIAAATLLFTAAQAAIPQPGAYTWANYAGLDGSFGFADAPGRAARFQVISSKAVWDSAGNAFVGESSRIRKITPEGVVSTFVGSATSGYLDGTGAAAQLGNPNALTIDAADNLYFGEGIRLRKATPAGVVTTLAGSVRGAHVDGTGTAARFEQITDLVIDPSNNDLYITDLTYLRKMTPDLVVTTVAGNRNGGFIDATGSAAGFHILGGIIVDSASNVYVADGENNAIRKITPAAEVTTIIGGHGAGYTDGPAATAQLSFPLGLVLDPAGNFFIVDGDNHAVRKVAPDGTVSSVAGGNGNGMVDGPGETASFSFDYGTNIARDAAGNLFVTDRLLRKIDADYVVSTFVGQGSRAGATDGPAAGAQFESPGGVAVDRAGNTFVVEPRANASAAVGSGGSIRKISAAGEVTTIVGFPKISDSIATDRSGNVFVGSYQNKRVYKMTPAGVISVVVAPEANVYPGGLATDVYGNLYVADKGYNVIRKITPAGVMTTLAGSSGTSGSADGTGAGASFAAPLCVAVDLAGNVYVGNADRIRKVTRTGVVTTLTTEIGAMGLAVDSAGDLYAANGDVIQKITAAGVVTTLGGTAGVATSLDGDGTAALFNSAVGIAINWDRVLYVADSVENRIAKGHTDYIAPPEPEPGPEPAPEPSTTTTPAPVAPTITAKGSTKLSTGSSVVKIKGTSNASVVRIEYKIGKKGRIHSVATGAAWTIKVKGLLDGTNQVYVRGVTATGVMTAFKKYKVTRE